LLVKNQTRKRLLCKKIKQKTKLNQSLKNLSKNNNLSLLKTNQKITKNTHFLPIFARFSKNPYKTTHFPRF